MKIKCLKFKKRHIHDESGTWALILLISVAMIFNLVLSMATYVRDGHTEIVTRSIHVELILALILFLINYKVKIVKNVVIDKGVDNDV